MKPATKKTFWARVKDILILPEAPPVPAVCIPPGARLMVHDVPISLQNQMGINPDEEVLFMQTTAAENRHRDAVRFRTGQVLRLQELIVGQRVLVVDLGNGADEEPHASENLAAVPAGSHHDW